MTVAQHIAAIRSRIESIAAKGTSPSPHGATLDDTLSRLDETGRRRVTMLLNRIKAFSENSDEQAAVEHIRRQAAEAWYGSAVSFSDDVATQLDERRTR